MAVRPVIRMGHPNLLKPAQPVTEFNCSELDALIEDMFDTMFDSRGVGLAAPQIDVSRRIMVFGFEKSERYPSADPVPLTVLINPEITVLDSEQETGWEGCLSIPGMRGLVPRYKQIQYRGVDQYGSSVSRSVTGFHARVVQHEFDHLEGRLYPSLIQDMRYFGFAEELFSPESSTKG